ncbi:MAG TPA: efflux RND transporter permease subunit [Terriglobales bacterium]|jgi:CzcA family heavy metal efflux pump|nr:efflux RND transporter permease subunit [Terriglobales bacterium]
MNLVRFCRRNSRAVFLIAAALTVAGLVSLFRLPSNIYPELTFPRVVILVHAGDLSPDTMLLTVTRPIEQQASTVLGVRRVRSRTIRGAAEISVLFSPGTDMQQALQMVQASVNEARTALPADTEIDVERLTPTVFPILSLILNGNVPDADLRDYAVYNLRPTFSRVPGVARVEVDAADTREVSVIIDPQKALAHRLSLPAIADRLRATNTVASVGRLDSNYQRFLVLTNTQFKSIQEIGDTVVGSDQLSPVRLREIATIREGIEDRKILVTGNGHPAAIINITRQIGGNIIAVSQQIKDIALHSGNIIPPSLHLSIVYDLAEFVRESIASVRDAILIGGFLAVVILFVFLRQARITLVAAISLPLTVIATFFFVEIFGGTLNLMSLGGLAIAIGLVIDDSVVVVENIYRHLGAGETAETAAEKGAGELIGPVLGSTLTTVVVFLPLGLLKGVVGDFFSALSLTLAASVLLSLVYSLTLVPLLAEYLLTKSQFRESSSRFMEPANRLYEKGIRWAIAHRRLVGIAAGTLIVLGGLAYFHLGSGFLPEMDEGGFVIDYLTPPGTSLAETDSLVKQMEQKVAQVPEVSAFSRRTGAELGLFATEQNKGDILVKLKPRSQRQRSAQEVIEDLRGQITRSVAGVNVEFVQLLQDMLGDLEGSPEPVEVKIFGNSSDELARIADELRPKIEKIPGIVDFKGPQRGNPELLIHVDPALAAHVGLTVDQVSQQVADGLLGNSSTDLRKADRLVPIRIRYPDSFRFQEQNIRQYPIINPNGQLVRLESLATISKERGQNELLRENQRLMVTLTARLENRDLGSAIEDVKKVLASTHLPVGCTFEIGGQYESQRSSFHDLLSVLGLALAAVFTVLVLQFRAFLPALVIMSAAPLSLIGVFFLLLVTSTPLNVSSFMGIILMVGLVVKNGIILFEYYERLHGKLSVVDALVQAGRIRLRPILMTTLCTLFGLLPLALGIGSGAELQQPLAIAVIGGLCVSMGVTLVIMPVLYATVRSQR